MKKKISAYWACQLGGWLLYGMTMLFFAFVFGQKLENYQYARLLVELITGIFVTHLFRFYLSKTSLKPPLHKTQWLKLIFSVLAITLLYPLVFSTAIEITHLYDPQKRFSFFQRFVFSLLTDTPIILTWTAIYFVWHYVEAGRKSEVDKVRLESLVKELELKTIKSHINPHFIFNALNSIRALVDENPQRARTAITELSNILRSSMQAEKVEMAPFERELNIVKDYLALEQIRFEDRLKVEYEIDDDTLDQPVPPMMLQTLVENAIKHGISKHVHGGIIKIISEFNDNHHELIVRNSGKLNGHHNEEGFGIISTQNRLNLLYGVKANFALKDINGDMVEAKVIIPVKAIN